MVDLYHFAIGVEDRGVFAEYKTIKSKQNVTDVDAEISALANGGASGWTDYSPAQLGPDPRRGLNIEFHNRDPKVLIFQLPDKVKNFTYFEKNRPLETLRLRGFRSADVISNTSVWPAKDKQPIWAIAQIDLDDALSEVKDIHKGAQKDGHYITRYPFVFNFVESKTGVSPAIKSLHKPNSSSDPKAMLTHGGIHPPDPANCMCAPPEGP